MERLVRVCLIAGFTYSLLLQLIGSYVHAGAYSNATSEPLLPAERVSNFAEKVERTLADSGARVAIVARAGRSQSQLPKGVQYTHVAFAVYSTISLQDGSTQPGYVMYNLYQQADKPERSTLVQDYPFEFFAAVPDLKAGIIVPVPELQRRLLQTLTSDTYQTLHNPEYSVIASPYNNIVQNCTEFVLNVLQAAIYQTSEMSFLKSTIRDHFTAMHLDINPFKLMFASAVVNAISISDHNGIVETATYGTIERYMTKHGLVKQSLRLSEEM